MSVAEKLSIHDVIDRFRETSLTNRERGDKFERLVKQFLLRDPVFSQRFDQVWLWSEWDGRGGRPDTGIDLVAQERESGGLCAVQCKFYEPGHTIAKGDIDSFLSASGKAEFTTRLIVSTTDRWNANAAAALDGQQVPVQRIGLPELADSSVDWAFAGPPEQLDVEVIPGEPRTLRPHQQAALDAVFAGFEQHDRGKLIMACGTGKTFTSLAIAERTARDAGGAGRVLFLVPSLALLSQTLREWTTNATMPLHAHAVCSDPKINRKAAAGDFGDIRVHDLAIPATTDGAEIAASLSAGEERGNQGLTVVFSTYHSIDALHEAQKLGAPDFDLVICDEAHRTTGVTLAGQDESHFTRVHDQSYLRSARRLYMTATPRLFDPSIKQKAEAKNAVLASMDDESLYGPEFHRLGFGEAVERNLLTDYKVLVLTVSERAVARTMQHQLAGEEFDMDLGDAAKMVGCWNGLAKRAAAGEGAFDFEGDEQPMQRAVAFLRTIKDSKQFASEFDVLVQAAEGDDAAALKCAVDHVDGTMNALERGTKLDWLKAPVDEGECRILSNARCLSEGVDVPDLDAVLFLSPRGSQVDVVQAVGRVMRKAEGKKFGYIVLPVAVPHGVEPAEALRDNKRFEAVWQVLQALRAHDERFEAMVNQLGLEPGKARKKVGTAHIGEREEGGEQFELALDLDAVPEWRDAIYSRIVDRVGERTYWEDWAKNVADIHRAQEERITAILDGPDASAAKEFERFLKALRANLNDGISRDDAISMLSQHLITRPVFRALFADYAFADHNPVSQVMDQMVTALGGAQLETELESLEGFYRSIELRVKGIDSDEGKQKVITELYEKFFQTAFKKTAQSLGIVYTPTEIVDFIIRAADDALTKHLGATLSDQGVHVLDPFTGTGTFIVRLLQSGRIKPEDLARKYASELHANELMLLAYYIAAINIEAAFHAQAGGDYVPFEGIALTDTFQSSEPDDTIDDLLMPQNNARIQAQLEKDITVIIGNPPYSVGQTSANDNNENVKYPNLDGRIEATYAALSTAQNKNSLYDSYIRAIRWATDRIGERGVVAFVSNGGWIDGNTADGIRLSMAGDFSDVYVYNLRGNARTAGELRRKEKDNVFGQGARTTVAILVAIKDPARSGECAIHYRDIGDYFSREEKLAIVAQDSIESIDWQPITPNAEGDWVNQRDARFAELAALVSSGDEPGVFDLHSAGLKTERDAWTYSSSSAQLRENVARTINAYNRVVTDLTTARNDDSGTSLDAVLTTDPAQFHWNAGARQDVAGLRRYSVQTSGFTTGSYRPFFRQHVYFHRDLNARRYQLPRLFPTPQHENVAIILTAAGSHFEFTPYISELLPNLHTLDTAQVFARWRYEPTDPNGTPRRTHCSTPARWSRTATTNRSSMATAGSTTSPMRRWPSSVPRSAATCRRTTSSITCTASFTHRSTARRSRQI